MADSYPFPATVDVASSVTLKLNARNYLMWKTQFESLLSSQKLIGFVNGMHLCPPISIDDHTVDPVARIPNPKYEEWHRTDQLVRSWILGTLSEEVLGCVDSLPSSLEIWNALTLAENLRVFELRQTLESIRKSGKTFLEYCREFSNICDQLSVIGQPLEESMKISTLLNGLDKEYDPVVISLLRLPPPTFNDVISEITAFDKRLQSREISTTVMASSSRSTPFSYNGGASARENHVCVTCNKSFPSYQALGGHRSNCNKVKILANHETRAPASLLGTEAITIGLASGLASNTFIRSSSNNGDHICKVCHKSFPSYKALGGHRASCNKAKILENFEARTPNGEVSLLGTEAITMGLASGLASGSSIQVTGIVQEVKISHWTAPSASSSQKAETVQGVKRSHWTAPSAPTIAQTSVPVSGSSSQITETVQEAKKMKRTFLDFDLTELPPKEDEERV